MRSLKIAGLCLAAMLVMGIATAGSAFAGPPLWLLCLQRAAGTGTHNDSNCKELGGTKEWRSEGVVKSDTIRIRGFTLLLEGTEGVEKSIIRCNNSEAIRGEGLLTTEKEGIINEFKIENFGANCERESGPCEAGGLETIEGVDLPWKQVIFETEKKTLGALREDGRGKLGWLWSCKTIFGSKREECIFSEQQFELINEVTTSSKILLVRGVFRNTAEGTCHIRGLVAILLPSGAGLSINLEK